MDRIGDNVREPVKLMKAGGRGQDHICCASASYSPVAAAGYRTLGLGDRPLRARRRALMLYLDASALVKRYVAESGSEAVISAMEEARAWAMCRIGFVERGFWRLVVDEHRYAESTKRR